MTLRALFAAGAAAALAACATPTPYGPAADGGYGYSDTRIETDRFRVSFRGNSLTDPETVQNGLLLRAAELTLVEGFDWFEIVDRQTDANRRLVATGRPAPYYGYHGRFHAFHPAYGWRSYYDPFWNDVTLREVTRYRAEAEIQLGRGARPDRSSVYDARDVERNLRAAVPADVG